MEGGIGNVFVDKRRDSESPEEKVPEIPFLQASEHCSEIGLMRISGSDRYTICRNCGKVLDERHTQY